MTPGIYNLIDLGQNFGSWAVRDAEYELLSHLEDCEAGCTLDLMVENMGRANFGAPHNFEQKKGQRFHKNFCLTMSTLVYNIKIK